MRAWNDIQVDGTQNAGVRRIERRLEARTGARAYRSCEGLQSFTSRATGSHYKI